ncbi:MAG TPA: 23S rRNA (adenine(1618)-N(6))-methyltransferase RlmF [Holophagaceae bacterium]|nr:23S rRNA (adenine(1618)-N(6))-methyltransferase RlmF [Holophagaceae bacterium]
MPKPPEAGRPKSPRTPTPAKATAPPKPGLHLRNRHRDRYDFTLLVKACPELARFVVTSPRGERTVDFADPAAVKLLNRALLKQVYGVEGWDVPEGYLCPPIPGRADYLHHLADLLATGPKIPKGPQVRVLDIGTGANLVYPLIGHREYGWSFVGTDIDGRALESAQRILQANPDLAKVVELRRQEDATRIFEGLLRPGERFDLCMCNPPFHASAAEAREGTERKWRNLGREEGDRRPRLNFGGQGSELWCPGGEAAFVRRMVEESARMPEACRWFTALLSKSENLKAVTRALHVAKVRETKIIDMAQGQKRSRIVAWTYQT